MCKGGRGGERGGGHRSQSVVARARRRNDLLEAAGRPGQARMQRTQHTVQHTHMRTAGRLDAARLACRHATRARQTRPATDSPSWAYQGGRRTGARRQHGLVPTELRKRSSGCIVVCCTSQMLACRQRWAVYVAGDLVLPVFSTDPRKILPSLSPTRMSLDEASVHN